MVGTVKVTRAENKSTTAAQKESLELHCLHGHVDTRHVQWLARAGKIKCCNAHAAANSRVLLRCAACLFGKMAKRPNNTTVAKQRPEKNRQPKERQGLSWPIGCIGPTCLRQTRLLVCFEREHSSAKHVQLWRNFCGHKQRARSNATSSQLGCCRHDSVQDLV